MAKTSLVRADNNVSLSCSWGMTNKYIAPNVGVRISNTVKRVDLTFAITFVLLNFLFNFFFNASQLL